MWDVEFACDFGSVFPAGMSETEDTLGGKPREGEERSCCCWWLFNFNGLFLPSAARVVIAWGSLPSYIRFGGQIFSLPLLPRFHCATNYNGVQIMWLDSANPNSRVSGDHLLTWSDMLTLERCIWNPTWTVRQLRRQQNVNYPVRRRRSNNSHVVVAVSPLPPFNGPCCCGYPWCKLYSNVV